jgi:hypothetical protein
MTIGAGGGWTAIARRQTSAISSTPQASLIVEVARAIWLTCRVVRVDREIDLKTGALPSPAVDRKGPAQCLDTVREADQTGASL